MRNAKRHRLGRRGRGAPLFARGLAAWLALFLEDAVRRILSRTPARPRRGYQAMRLGRISRERWIALILGAIVLGAVFGYAIGWHEAPPSRVAGKLLHPTKPAPPSTPRTADVPSHVAQAPKPLPSPAPPAQVPASKQAEPRPIQVESPTVAVTHEEPTIVYEEPTAPEEASSAARVGEAERRPVLTSMLASLAFKPPPGPQPLWLRNAAAMPATGGRPMIALVIDDMGVDRKRSARASVHLPRAVTLSFLPYAQEVAKQVEAARAEGHEVMLHVPMEPENATIDPGPHALRLGESPDEILRRLDWDLAQFTGYVAINNHMGSKFTRDASAMQVVLREVKARGLFFLDSRTTASTAGARVAHEIGLAHLERDVFLDNVDTRQEVSTRLADLERDARHYGYAVAIGHPRDATLDVLEKWVAAVQERGFVLVPISAAMRIRLAAEQEPRT